MRVGIICIQHESNTFLRSTTTLEHFRNDRLLVGEQIRDTQSHAHHEVGGFLEALDQNGIEAVPLLMAVAMPSGVVTAQTFRQLLALMDEQLDRAGPLDGLLVAPHGAAVAEDQPDMDGYWLTRVRNRVGPDVPMVCTLDLHANVSQAMIDACDATISYRTNPHLDQRQRGIEAATLIARTLREEICPTQAVGLPPMVINIERQLTRDEPCRSLFAQADQIASRPGVLSVSINLGFPYADVKEMGASFIVVTDRDHTLAGELAWSLASHAWHGREAFRGELIAVDDAIQSATRARKPVCLLDMGDNVGGGSAADGTWLAHALQQDKSMRALVSLFDPVAVRIASSAGVGRQLRLAMGGRTDSMHGEPLADEVTVLGLFDGKFSESQPRHGGRTDYDMGPTAVVQTDAGLTIQLTSSRVAPFSLGQLTSCRLDPKGFDVIVVKGVHGPVAAYEGVCPTLIRVDTPGSTSANLDRLQFKHRRVPLYPFEDPESATKTWTSTGR